MKFFNPEKPKQPLSQPDSKPAMEQKPIEPELAEKQGNQPDFTPRFEYPPSHVVFPPPADLYTLGTVDMQVVARRLIEARSRAKHFLPAPSSHEVNEAIICAALGLPEYSPITLELLQQIHYALAYEPKAHDGSGNRFQYWPSFILSAAVSYRGLTKFGYGALKDPPLNPNDGSYMGKFRRELAGRV